MADELITALHARLRSGQNYTEAEAPWRAAPGAPVLRSAVGAAEKRLGFALPPLLTRLYIEVANGGFGPSYGLLGLEGGCRSSHGESLESEYAAKRTPDPSDPYWSWPEELLPAFELGCGMYLCVDARSAQDAVVLYEPNPHEDGAPWTDAFFRSPHGLSKWLESWLSGADLVEELWTDMSPAYGEA